MTILDRYTSAVNAKNLKVSDITQGAADILGAYGLASKKSPLAVALSRLMAGDSRVMGEIVNNLSKTVWKKSRAYKTLRMTDLQSIDFTKECLLWWLNNTCKSCGGHGQTIIPGTTTLSERDCKDCNGTGKTRLSYKAEKLELANWTISEIEKALSQAGPEAMRKLA